METAGVGSTPGIHVFYRGALAAKTGRGEETLSAGSVRDLLGRIKSAYGKETEKLARTMLITVNGKSILRLKLFNTPLGPGDEVHFLPICAGGC